MATVPVEITWTTGQVVTAAQLNSNMRDAINFVIAPPLAILRQTVAQSIATATFTAVTLDTEDIDRDGGHSTVTNTSRYTAQTAGYYLAAGHISYASNATGRRWAKWVVNTSTDVTGGANNCNAVNGDTTDMSCPTRRIFLNVADFLELFAFQDSGGALNTSVGGREQPVADLQWVST